jgi:hypothetical protein
MPLFALKSESHRLRRTRTQLRPLHGIAAIFAVALLLGDPHVRTMSRKSPLDDPENAAHAWARYRRIMKLLMSVTVGTVLFALALLYAYNGAVSVHFYIAVALGISFTMLLGGALMGLVFLSHGTGHDDSVDNRLPSRDELWGKDED